MPNTARGRRNPCGRLAGMSLDLALLDILVCPEDKGPLDYHEDEQVLVNPRLKRAYPVEDGIPVMLIDEVRDWDGD